MSQFKSKLLLINSKREDYQFENNFKKFENYFPYDDNVSEICLFFKG
jgi:hypothetical protein